MIPMIILSLFFMQSMIDKNKKNVTICIVLMFVLPLIFYSFLGNLVMDILASGKGRNYGAAVDLSNSTGRMEVTVLHFEKNRNKVMSWKGVMYESD